MHKREGRFSEMCCKDKTLFIGNHGGNKPYTSRFYILTTNLLLLKCELKGGKPFGKTLTCTLSPIGRIKILTYLIWGFLGAAIFDCIIRSCDLFYWFIRTCLGPTDVPTAITSLEIFCVLTMCYFSDNVSSKENIKILWLIFMFYYSDIIAIKNSYWFFSFT